MADQSTTTHYQIVAQMAATLWASKGWGNVPTEAEIDRINRFAWDIYTSALRESKAAFERHRAKADEE